MREDLIWEAERMFHERWLYYTIHRNYEAASSYKSASDILVAALSENEEVLRQFDYYHDEIFDESPR